MVNEKFREQTPDAWQAFIDAPAAFPVLVDRLLAAALADVTENGTVRAKSVSDTWASTYPNPLARKTKAAV